MQTFNKVIRKRFTITSTMQKLFKTFSKALKSSLLIKKQDFSKILSKKLKS